jgi:two-component system LytT family response regulator
MIRALIVDDESLARRKLKRLLRREADIEIVGEAADGGAAVDAIRNEKPDIVFLDIQMPEMDGFSVIATIGVERMPYVIFVTAYDQYALKAFDVRALDYLLKPFDGRRLEKALDQARRQFELAGGHEEFRRQVRSILQEIKPERFSLERILVKSKGRIVILRTAEIDWIESAGNYVTLHCGPESHLVRETMAEIAGKLDSGTFIRIHRSSIVNIDRIKEIQPSFHGEYDVILKTGVKLVLSRTFGEKFKRAFSTRA